MSKADKQKKDNLKKAEDNFSIGFGKIMRHPLFEKLAHKVTTQPIENSPYLKDGFCFVFIDGAICFNSRKLVEPSKWERMIAHCLLHLGMEHFKKRDQPLLWNIACDCVVEKFLNDLRFGDSPSGEMLPSIANDEEKLYEHLCSLDSIAKYTGFGTAGNGADMIFEDKTRKIHVINHHLPPYWPKAFADGLSLAVYKAVSVASGENDSIYSAKEPLSSAALRAKQWFISSYPLLGAIASSFKIIEDPLICQRMGITTAAVSPSLSEIYINPSFYLDNNEMRFVLAHEILHAALRHDERQEWRDAYLWNVACDYVINQWLTEMEVGERPEGLLYDEQFKGLNCEAVYDRITADMRRYRKLATLRGVGLGDILPGSMGSGGAIDLDEFYRRAFAQGLSYHQEQGRGYLPEGLIEEIRALSHPPIPWDVELARWFEEQFPPLEMARSYSRPSRRQPSTPDIPRPSWSRPEPMLNSRTFGVVLDTSGSMDRGLLAKALGAAASYSASRDVLAARVVFCDAEAYDMGYMRPEDIAGNVKVKGRGGTVLQPGVDLLLKAEDFPKNAPILIITDGWCDRVALNSREHAYLIPEGASLPFVPKGKVFRMK